SAGSGATTLCGQDAIDFGKYWQDFVNQAWTISAPYFVDYETRGQLQFLNSYTGDNTFNFMEEVDQDSAEELKKLQDEIDGKGYSAAATLLGTVLTVLEKKNSKKNTEALETKKASTLSPGPYAK
uniref:hypothetical protein n=1 Tax=Cellvibrio mixtus TaxID=39650 RepID=UPI001363206D